VVYRFRSSDGRATRSFVPFLLYLYILFESSVASSFTTGVIFRRFSPILAIEPRNPTAFRGIAPNPRRRLLDFPCSAIGSSYSNTEEKLLSYASWIHRIRRPGDSSGYLGSLNFSASGQFFLVPRVQRSADRLDIFSLNNPAPLADFSDIQRGEQQRQIQR
jgi:hypothetical protein